jgi:hypothetical protein
MTAAFERSGSRASAQRARRAYLDVQQKLGITARDIDENDRRAGKQPRSRADVLAT